MVATSSAAYSLERAVAAVEPFVRALTPSSPTALQPADRAPLPIDRADQGRLENTMGSREFRTSTRVVASVAVIAVLLAAFTGIYQSRMYARSRQQIDATPTASAPVEILATN